VHQRLKITELSLYADFWARVRDRMSNMLLFYMPPAVTDPPTPEKEPFFVERIDTASISPAEAGMSDRSLKSPPSSGSPSPRSQDAQDDMRKNVLERDCDAETKTDYCCFCHAATAKEFLDCAHVVPVGDTLVRKLHARRLAAAAAAAGVAAATAACS
jgi:hypothetical protein